MYQTTYQMNAVMLSNKCFEKTLTKGFLYLTFNIIHGCVITNMLTSKCGKRLVMSQDQMRVLSQTSKAQMKRSWKKLKKMEVMKMT